ncbi:MAG: biopolymer transporter ExbD [Deltaproteobacteria bacterium]|jgi:biopolymer transport protein TolR|nr:biopolymer transporter ExbD [Deltaproteobacteria bacterium]
MAFSFHSQGDNHRHSMMSEINVTPMVDVMLVLLIIFMVAAPMMTQGLEVDLPKVDANVMRTDQDMVILTITKSGQVLLDDTPLANVNNLDAQIKQVMRTKGTESVFLKADREVAYGHVAAVMGTLRLAGVVNVGLVTEPGGEGDLPLPMMAPIPLAPNPQGSAPPAPSAPN